MAVLTKFHTLFFLRQNRTCFCLVAGSLSCQDLDTYELRKKRQHLSYKNATIFLPVPKYTFYCRLSNPDSVALLGMDSWACCCHVDILIHNAGVPSRSTFLEAIPEVDAEVMRVTFLSSALLAETLMPAVIQQRLTGALVWIAGFQG